MTLKPGVSPVTNISLTYKSVLLIFLQRQKAMPYLIRWQIRKPWESLIASPLDSSGRYIPVLFFSGAPWKAESVEKRKSCFNPWWRNASPPCHGQVCRGRIWRCSSRHTFSYHAGFQERNPCPICRPYSSFIRRKEGCENIRLCGQHCAYVNEYVQEKAQRLSILMLWDNQIKERLIPLGNWRKDWNCLPPYCVFRIQTICHFKDLVPFPLILGLG